MNRRIIVHTLGIVLNFEAAALVLPLICALILRESCINVFLISIAICLLAGTILTWKRPGNKTMYAKEGFVIVALSWFLISIFGAIPFYISGAIPNFIDAFFETASGFTTTGASILKNVEALPKSMLMWRSFTHWIGGMGVLVLLVAILPLSGSKNMFLIRAESPGPEVNKLVSRVGSTAKILYGMYLFFTVTEIIFLLAGGFDLFEALTISFGTAGTGGFAILNSGLASYSPYIQIVVTVFMILFGVDFSVYYLLIMRRFKAAFRSEEVRMYIGVVIAASLVIALNCMHIFKNFGVALRYSAFQVASVITTTGYATTDFNMWPELSKTILVLLMFSGACAGSTGGGIKVSRLMLLAKSIKKEIKIAVHPQRIYKVKMSGRIVEHETVRAVNVFLAAYLLIFAVSLLIISINGFDFTTNFTSVLATLNNIGPGLNMVGPAGNFSAFSSLSKLVFIFDMIAGRLEIFPLLVLFSVPSLKK